jgi:hypothetical protein
MKVSFAYVIIHTWPNGSPSIMPTWYTTQTEAQRTADKFSADDSNRGLIGHGYTIGSVPLAMLRDAPLTRDTEETENVLET